MHAGNCVFQAKLFSCVVCLDVYQASFQLHAGAMQQIGCADKRACFSIDPPGIVPCLDDFVPCDMRYDKVSGGCGADMLKSQQHVTPSCPNARAILL